MSTNDTLRRFIFEKASVRGELIHLGKSFQTIVGQHRYPPVIQKLLGEALCVAGLLTAIIKFNGRLTVQFRGKGPLKMLLAQCDNRFRLRGLVKWEGEMSYDELMDSFHQGVLVIMLDYGPQKNRYQGIVSWRGNSLTESIEGYFKESEQLSTKIWLAVNEKSAAGLMLQIIPAKEKALADFEKTSIDPHWDHITHLTAGLKPFELLNLTPETLLTKLYPSEEIRLFAPEEVMFKCTCSRKHGRDAIYLLGREEAEAELKDKQVIVVTCDFCNKEYVYDRVDVAEIFENDGKPPTDTHLH